MRLSLAAGAAVRVLRNLGYVPGRDVTFPYPVELDPASYPLGTTIVSATLVILDDFSGTPALTKTITAVATADGQITNTGVTGVGNLFFALTPQESNQFSGTEVFEVVVVDSLGRQGSLDAGAFVRLPTSTGAPVAQVLVAPAPFTFYIGQTQQLTATVYDAQGNVLLGRVVTWATSDPTIATVSASGLVTAVGAGAAQITAMSEGNTGIAAATTGTDLQFRATFLVGAATQKALYSSISSPLSQGGGIATEIDDALGLAPPLVPNGTGLTVVTPAAPAKRHFRSVAPEKMRTALSARFDNTLVKAVVYIGTLAGRGSNNYPLNLADDANASLLGVSEAGGGNPGYIALATTPNFAEYSYSHTLSSKVFLFIFGRNGAVGSIQVPPIPRADFAITAAVAGNCRVNLPPTDTDDDFYCVDVLDHWPSDAEIAGYLQLCRGYYHGVSGSPFRIAVEGDSIAAGYRTSTFKNNWLTRISEDAFFADYHPMNVGQPGARVKGDAGGAALNMTTRAAVFVDPLLDPNGTRRILIMQGGTNDIALDGKSGLATAADLYAWCDARVGAGWPKGDLWITTILPRNVGVSQATFDTESLAFNTEIRANFGLHAGHLWDIRANAAFVSNSAWNTANFDADGVHPNDAGHLIMANDLNPRLQAAYP